MFVPTILRLSSTHGSHPHADAGLRTSVPMRNADNNRLVPVRRRVDTRQASRCLYQAVYGYVPKQVGGLNCWVWLLPLPDNR